MNKGYITQVTGPVVDVQFSKGCLPSINNALVISISADKNYNNEINLTLEVALHIGDDTVRCIAMDATEGLRRGMEVLDTEGPILVPVGRQTLGRIFNVLGKPIDYKPDVSGDTPRLPIHRDAPTLCELSGKTEILETGIKVVDLLAPYIKGGKIGDRKSVV